MHIEYTAAQNIPTTTETLIGTIPAFTNNGLLANEPTSGNAPVPSEVTGTANITPGASTTQITVRVRQAVAGGALTGAVLDGGVAQADDVTAAVPVEISFTAYDAVGSVLGYVITAQQTAATGAGTANLVSADANAQ